MGLNLVGNYKCPICKRIAYYMTRLKDGEPVPHLITGYYKKEHEHQVETKGICPCRECGLRHTVVVEGNEGRKDNAA